MQTPTKRQKTVEEERAASNSQVPNGHKDIVPINFYSCRRHSRSACQHSLRHIFTGGVAMCPFGQASVGTAASERGTEGPAKHLSRSLVERLFCLRGLAGWCSLTLEEPMSEWEVPLTFWEPPHAPCWRKPVVV
jgi:hypothetical protein